MLEVGNKNAPTWTAKVCKIIAFMSIIMGLGLLFYNLQPYQGQVTSQNESPEEASLLDVNILVRSWLGRNAVQEGGWEGVSAPLPYNCKYPNDGVSV